MFVHFSPSHNFCMLPPPLGPWNEARMQVSCVRGVYWIASFAARLQVQVHVIPQSVMHWHLAISVAPSTGRYKGAKNNVVIRGGDMSVNKQ